jgi:uncharacterized protein (TIGR03118 family)
LASVVTGSALWAGPIGGFAQTNLVSNIPALAQHTDPNLRNPWGIAESASSPFWVSNNASSTSTLYNTSGTPQALVVSLLGPTGAPSSPTGQVFQNSGAFNGDLFLFATEEGQIQGWRGALGTTAENLFDDSGAGSIFKGLAFGSTSPGNNYLYAADFHNAQIVVHPSTGAPALAGNFTDPNLPAGYAPFNIQNIGGQLFVTYALQDATGHDDVPGAGNGFVDIFDLNGNLVRRLVSNGVLNSPWGVAQAPAGFGALGGDYLIGNFGDGSINVFDINGALVGTLADVNGIPLVNSGLWALRFGNGGNGGHTGTLYLTAGLNDEADGLFAQIDFVPEPGTFALLALGAVLIVGRARVTR